jgi:ATP-dependent helicase YprA (DUF1998 family)
MTEELLKALQLIKDECEKHPNCYGCPMLTGEEKCGINNDIPAHWKLKKREVYF